MLIIYYYVRDFFTFIGDTVSTIFDLLESVIDVAAACGRFLTSVFGSLPTLFTVFIVALVAISIIYKILGREGATD